MACTLLDKIMSQEVGHIPSVLFVVDSEHVSGRGLVWALAMKYMEGGKCVHYLTTSLTPSFIQRSLDIKDNFQLKIYDGFSDPCSWKNQTHLVCLRKPIDTLFSLSREQENVIIIDSLNDIVIHQDRLSIVESVHRLVKWDNAPGHRVEQICMIGSQEVLDDSTRKGLGHIADAVIKLHPTFPPTCTTSLRKPSGKLLRNNEVLTLSPNYVIHIAPVDDTKKSSVDERPDSEAIIAAQTTFSLTLTEEQKLVKNELALPCFSVQDQGQIHYTPAEEDDWDDDDPDEDLEI